MPHPAFAIFSSPKLAYASDLVHALAHEHRLDILQTLKDQGSMTLPELQESTGLDASSVTQHLRILRQVELLETSKEGRFIAYSLVVGKYERAIEAISHFNELSEVSLV